MCILHAIFICKKEQGRGGKEEERKGERRAEDTTRAKSRQRRGRWAGGGAAAAAAPAAGGGCAFFSSSAWLYRIKASRSRTLLSAFTQAAEKERSLVFFWFGLVLPYCVLLLSTILLGEGRRFSFLTVFLGFLIVFLLFS